MNIYKATPIHCAVNKKDEKTTEKLIELGANVNLGRPLQVAVAQYSEKIIKLLLKSGRGSGVGEDCKGARRRGYQGIDRQGRGPQPHRRGDGRRERPGRYQRDRAGPLREPPHRAGGHRQVSGRPAAGASAVQAPHRLREMGVSEEGRGEVKRVLLKLCHFCEKLAIQKQKYLFNKNC